VHLLNIVLVSRKFIRKYEDGSLEKYLGCQEGTIAKYFKNTAQFISNLEWAWNSYNTEYKRVQLPPVLLTSRRAFGFDRRDTIATSFISQDYLALKAKLLGSSDAAP
jgi:NAD+ synthase (glutamine-hydrolysing)